MPLDQLTILAPGLIGSSVARAARERRVAKRIVIWARRSEVRHALVDAKLGDAVAETVEAAAKGASLVVVAAPVDAIVPLLREISGVLEPGAIVTDVGSVKGEIARQGHAALKGGPAHFVGSHPMAGSEKTGWRHGVADLFEGRTCFVTPLRSTDPKAVAVAAKFWADLGGKVVNVDPAAHDRIVAHISHLPQVVASALCSFLASENQSWRDYAGGGLRDTTRIAGSDPELWRTILDQNRSEVLTAVQGFQAELARLEKALVDKDWNTVVKTMARGKEYRRGIR
jgi:prephenate dehydrogenase